MAKKLTIEEKELRYWERREKLLGPEKVKELVKEVENRLSSHLLQAPETLNIDKSILGGQQFFGVEKPKRLMDEPRRIESKYALEKTILSDGSVMGAVVTLRCWEDWDCRTAIEYNKSMVARVCYQRKLSFSSRAQTEVQTRTVIMWMRLRGKFFWNKNNKTNLANLYFDDTAKVLRVIHSDDFQNWLLSHTQISPDKADFKALMHQIDAAAMNHEISHECVPGALFDRRGNNVYISCGDSEMIRVSPAVDGEPQIDRIKNGDDDVVFTAGMTLAPWNIVSGEGEDPFTCCPPFSTANYQSEHGRMIARLWFLGLAACLRSYPAIVFTGKMRSGKSRTAKGLFELLGAPIRLSAIRANGESDFWTVLNKGGVVCFDNVDTKNVWFGDAMQLACTDGSTEARTLFTNDQTTTLRANAKIVMTSNNPMFAAESGLADRLQIVRLGQFDGKNGKESGDTAITEAIADNRDAAMTWFARTVSRGLADDKPVESNVNMRHPDFAAFSMRCARALGESSYKHSILALKSAEFDKALLTIQNTQSTNYVYEALLDHFSSDETASLVWSGTATNMLESIVKIHPDLSGSKFFSATSIGKAMAKYIDQFAVLFDVDVRKKGPQTYYNFKSFSDMYIKNVGLDSQNIQLSQDEEQTNLDDLI